MLSPTKDFTVLPKNANSASAIAGESFPDFIRRQAIKRDPKVLAALLGVTTRTVTKMRAGECADSKASLIRRWCQRDHEFRTDYFRHCGGHIEGDPALVKGVSAAIAAVIAWRAAEGVRR